MVIDMPVLVHVEFVVLKLWKFRSCSTLSRWSMSLRAVQRRRERCSSMFWTSLWSCSDVVFSTVEVPQIHGRVVGIAGCLFVTVPKTVEVPQFCVLVGRCGQRG